jgi:hypothetical protein
VLVGVTDRILKSVLAAVAPPQATTPEDVREDREQAQRETAVRRSLLG